MINLFERIRQANQFKDFAKDNGVALHKHQLKWFTMVNNHKLNLICSARRLGKSLFVKSYCKWLLDQNPNVRIAVVVINYPNKEYYNDIKSKVKIYSSFEYEKMSTGLNYDVIIFDEFCYHDDDYDLNAVYCRNRKSKFIFISSLAGRDAFYENVKKYTSIVNSLKSWLGLSTIAAIRTPAKLTKKRRKNMDSRSFNKEFLCKL